MFDNFNVTTKFLFFILFADIIDQINEIQVFYIKQLLLLDSKHLAMILDFNQNEFDCQTLISNEHEDTKHLDPYLYYRLKNLLLINTKKQPNVM